MAHSFLIWWSNLLYIQTFFVLRSFKFKSDNVSSMSKNAKCTCWAMAPDFSSAYWLISATESSSGFFNILEWSGYGSVFLVTVVYLKVRFFDHLECAETKTSNRSNEILPEHTQCWCGRLIDREIHHFKVRNQRRWATKIAQTTSFWKLGTALWCPNDKSTWYWAKIYWHRHESTLPEYR